jgi:hypothetical protein
MWCSTTVPPAIDNFAAVDGVQAALDDICGQLRVERRRLKPRGSEHVGTSTQGFSTTPAPA